MDSVSLQVWRADISDVPTVAQVLLCAFQSFRPLYTQGGFAATTPSAETIGQRFHEGPIWLAVTDGETLGTVAAMVRGERLYVRSMAVLPSARGRGVGSALLREVEGYAAEQRCRSLYLSTTPFLHDAIRLYERFGFRRVEEEPQNLFGTPLFTMEKQLQSE